MFKVYIIFNILLLLSSYNFAHSREPKIDNCIPLDEDMKMIIKKHENDKYKIGEGLAGTIYDISKTKPGLVMKHIIVDKDNFDRTNKEVDLMREIQKLKEDASSPYEKTRNLISISLSNGCYYSSDDVYILMKKFSCDLSNLITSSNNLDKDPLWAMAATMSLAKTLTRFHSLNIIHSDIKPDNILVKNPFELFLADYSLISILDQKKSNFFYQNNMFKEMKQQCVEKSSIQGTLNYMPSEIWNTGKYYRGSDVYSLGILIFEIFNGIIPEKNTYKRIITACPDDKSRVTKEEDRNMLTTKIYCLYYNNLIQKMIYSYAPHRPIDSELLNLIDEATKQGLKYYNSLFLTNKKRLEAQELDLQKRKEAPTFSKPYLGYSFSKIGEFFKMTKSYDQELQDKKKYLNRHSISAFLSNLIKTVDIDNKKNCEHKVSVIKDHSIFFEQLEDKGISLLGCEIDNYSSDNCKNENNSESENKDIEGVSSTVNTIL